MSTTRIIPRNPEELTKAVECVANAISKKETADAWFKEHENDVVGRPSDGDNCPLYSFLTTACPEAGVSEVGGYIGLTAPEWIYDLDDYEEKQRLINACRVEMPVWASDFISRLDNNWRGVVGDIGMDNIRKIVPTTYEGSYYWQTVIGKESNCPITGEMAANILYRSGTDVYEGEAYQEWVDNKRQALTAT